MPAIMTHHLFGEDASALLPKKCIAGQEELLAFLIGNQGSDPLWARFRTTPRVARTCHTLANEIHEGNVVAFIFALRRAAAQLDEKDRPLGYSFTLGMSAHYLLDSMTHPLIIALAKQLQDANPELSQAEGEIHALLESDIDTWMIWQKRHKTILEAPSKSALASTVRIRLIAGRLVSSAAKAVFDIDLKPAEYGRALRDYGLFYKLIDPPSSLLPNALKRLELLRRQHSRLEAQRHHVSSSDECLSANLTHEQWRDCVTGEVSTASFADLFHDALLAWPTFATRIIEGDEARVRAMVGNLDYYGRPM